MQIKTIAYSESREAVSEIGLKTWFKYGIEIELNEGENGDIVADIAKSFVKKWHKEVNPSSYFQSTELPVIQNNER